jgi:AraC family transcriptional activator of pobA
MEKTETLEAFYQHKFNKVPLGMQNEAGHFNVFRIEDCNLPGAKPITYSRRDFYKITLICGKNRYHYADKSVEVDGPNLIFFNPLVPYLVEPLSEGNTGFFCIFTRAFFTEKIRGSLDDLPVFAAGGQPAYMLTAQQQEQVTDLFTRMLAEINSDYAFKYDLLRNYVTELTHIALKSRPSGTIYQHADANTRITAVFNEVLERQFPIESPLQRLTMRSAKDYAAQMRMHVNHLNRAVKLITGKTTTSLIAGRMVSEAKILLKHTDWNVSEIGYSLGFEEPSHFANFFKKQTQTTPLSYRLVAY